ncbi:Pikachurin, partial [Armadillidium nasatum]
MSISNQPIHLVSGAISGTNIDSCDHPCSTHPCDNGGICEPQKENFSCRCPLGFNDPHCRSRVVTQVATPSFSGRSFLKYSDNEILKSRVVLRYNLGSGFAVLSYNASGDLDDGEWH